MLLLVAVIGAMPAAATEVGREEARDAESEDPPGEFAPTPESENPWMQQTLTGDWGGLRNSLAERGVTLGLAYTGDMFGIVSGGLHRGTDFLGNWDLTLTVETEPLLGWRGGRLFVYGIGLWRTGSPSENAGDIQTLDNIDAPEEWKLYEAWLQQEIFGGRSSLLAGLYDVNGEFDVIEAATLFINSSFGIGRDISQTGANGPSIFPETAFGVRLDTRPVAKSYVRFAVLDGVPGDPDGTHAGPGYFAFSREDGVLCVGETGYVAGEEEGSEQPYTKIGLGGWYYSSDVDRIGSFAADGSPRRRHGNYGMYLLGERVVYRESAAPERGLAAFVRVGWADSEVDATGFYVGGGAVYTGPLRWRPEDQLGLGIAAAIPGDEFERASEDAGTPVDGAEVAIELTYRMQLTPWLSLQPDLQYIVNPGFGDGVDDALALGTRIEIAF